MNDVIKDLGYLTMGSRLKRLGECMQADVSRLVKAEGHDVQAGFLPALGILAERGPTTVGDLALALGIAQPGVTRMLGQLKKQKLVTMDRTKTDQRQRMISLTKAMAADYSSYGIRVNAVCPAGVWTPMLEQWCGEQADPASIRTYLDDIHLLGPCPHGDVIADAAVFLLSHKARFITGCILPVSGGAELGYRR